MKKFVVTFLMVCVLITGVLIFPVFGEQNNSNYDNVDSPRDVRGGTRGNTLFVGDGQTYKRIQDAIDNASAGDTVRVYDGTYYENVTINKKLTIIGNGSLNTIIDGNNKDSVVRVNEDVCIIKGFKITGSGTWGFHPDLTAAFLIRANNTRIIECTCENNFDGIDIDSGNFNIIENCICNSNTDDGMDIYFAKGTQILNCTITRSNDDAIRLTDCYDSGLLRNINIKFNNFRGLTLIRTDDHIIDNSTFMSNGYEGILFTYSEKNLIKDNIIINNSNMGINLNVGTLDNIVYHNSFFENGPKTSILQAQDYGGLDFWDNGKEGNYWSDWIEPDNNSDGIVDVPYNLTGGAGGVDNYPLMNPIKTLGSGRPIIITKNKLKAYVGNLYSVSYTAVDDDTPKNNLIWTMKTNASWLNFSESHTLFGIPFNSDIGQYWVNIFVSDGNENDSTTFTLKVVPDPNGSVFIERTGQGYKKIQDAVDAAISGDTINVFGGDYKEDIIINKSLNLIDKDKIGSLIEAKNYTALQIQSNYVNVLGFIIKNSNTGIQVSFSEHFIIKNCNLADNTKGMYLDHSKFGTITDCKFENNFGFAVELAGGYSSNNKISIWNNSFYLNNGAGFVYNSSHIQASDNTQSGKNDWNSTSGRGNFWSDWTSPDNDKNGIVDVPYNISGSASAKDFYPISQPIQQTTFSPRITIQNVLTTYVGKLYSVNYTAIDLDTPQNELIWTMKTNASWLHFSNTQELFGTPSISDLGRYWVNISVSDGNHSDSTNFTLGVLVGAKPEIKTENILTAYVGKFYSVNYVADDPDTPKNKLIWTMRTNASWLTFSNNQELNGTPSNQDIGTYWINITVYDGLRSDFSNFTLTVIAGARPNLTTGNILIAYVGQKYSVNYSASDPDTPQENLTWVMNTNASWLNLSTTQELSGTPSNSDIGTYWVYISVSDGARNDFTNFTLTVKSKGLLPNITLPEINSTNIANNSKNVSINNTIIIIKFSKSMNRTSVELSLRISPFSNYTLIWNKDYTELTIIFNENLSYNTTYKVTISTSAKDDQGNKLIKPFELVFTTQKKSEIDDDGDGEKSKPDNGEGRIQNLMMIGIIVVILIIIIFLITLAFVVQNRRKKHEETESTKEVTGEVNVSNGIDEYIMELKDKALKLKKPSDFEMSENEILNKVETEYRKGNLSKETYNEIKEKYSEQEH